MTDNFRTDVLREAIALINGDRNNDYGDPIDNFRTIAEFWQSYLTGTIESRGELLIRPHDVAVLMDLVKTSRLIWSPDKKDHWADKAGYSACGWDCVQRQNGTSDDC